MKKNCKVRMPWTGIILEIKDMKPIRNGCYTAVVVQDNYPYRKDEVIFVNKCDMMKGE